MSGDAHRHFHDQLNDVKVRLLTMSGEAEAALGLAVEALLGVVCPLTEWEFRLRELAGQQVERQLSFVARLVRSIIFYDFPSWVFTAAYVGFAVLVAGSFLLIPPRRRKR